MISFKAKSYQLKETKKWVSSGVLSEQGSDSGIVTKKRSFTNNIFDTKKEADTFFTNYCIQKGYISIN